MQRCKIVTWIVILSIVNFALGAPAAVRRKLEMLVDVDVAEGRGCDSYVAEAVRPIGWLVNYDHTLKPESVRLGPIMGGVRGRAQ
jgi:hypothetical protein